MVKNTTAWKSRKIQITRCEKSRFYPKLAKVWMKTSKIRIKQSG